MSAWEEEIEKRLNELEKKPCMQITELFTPSEVRIFKLNIRRITESEREITELKNRIENVRINIENTFINEKCFVIKEIDDMKEVLNRIIDGKLEYGSNYTFWRDLKKQLKGSEKECPKNQVTYPRGNSAKESDEEIYNKTKFLQSQSKLEKLKKQLITEFLQDWRWGKALDNHYERFETVPHLMLGCHCNFDYWKWFEKKLENQLREKGYNI